MHLAARPVRTVVRALADAAQRWTDGDFPPRVRALEAVCERTGYSAPVVEYAFDRLFSAITQQEIETTIAGELGSVDVLERFVDRTQPGRFRAVPCGRVCVISSRTTIGVAIVPAVFALAARCDVVVKDREDRFVAAFFETLAEELPELRHAAVARTWSGQRDAADLGEFGAVVAFGDDATLAQIRSSLPLDTRMIAFGSKASIGYIAREALENESSARLVAERAARDLVLYETEGCLSLHALFVERGGSIHTQAFAQLLAHAVERSAVEFPPRVARPHETVKAGAARDLAAFRAALGTGVVHSDP